MKRASVLRSGLETRRNTRGTQAIMIQAVTSGSPGPGKFRGAFSTTSTSETGNNVPSREAPAPKNKIQGIEGLWTKPGFSQWPDRVGGIRRKIEPARSKTPSHSCPPRLAFAAPGKGVERPVRACRSANQRRSEPSLDILGPARTGGERCPGELSRL